MVLDSWNIITDALLLGYDNKSSHAAAGKYKTVIMKIIFSEITKTVW